MPGRSKSLSPYFLSVALGILAACLLSRCGQEAENPAFALATTTSVTDSGLLAHLQNSFKRDTRIVIHPVAVGSGKALQMAARKEVNVTITHDPEAERAFVSTGHARMSRPFMWNAFVIVGPHADPAGVRGSQSAADAFTRIHHTGARFCSRSDQSGTHRRELQIWESTGLDPERNSAYLKTGQPMGALLRAADDIDGYALTDRATFENLSSAIQLEVLFEGDPILRNVYTISLVRRDPLEAEDRNAQAFADWLLSAQGKKTIESFQVKGKQQFFVK